MTTSLTPKRPCLGCGRLTRRARCRTCRANKDAQYGGTHRALRKQVLERDGYKCRCSGCASCEGHGRCMRVATTADHIVPLGHHGKSEMDNYQAMCQPCNSGKRDRQ